MDLDDHDYGSESDVATANATTNTSVVSENDAENAAASVSMSPRIEAFLRSVVLVHRHNSNNVKDEDDETLLHKTHTLTLNRFSDVPAESLPLMTLPSSSSSSSSGHVWEDLNHVLTQPVDGSEADTMNGATSLKLWLNELTNLETANSLERLRRRNSKQRSAPAFVQLDNDEVIMEFGERIRQTRQSRGSRRLDTLADVISVEEEATEGRITTTVQRQLVSPNTLSLSFYPMILSWGANAFQNMRDSWWWIGGGHEHENGNHGNSIHSNDSILDTTNDTTDDTTRDDQSTEVEPTRQDVEEHSRHTPAHQQQRSHSKTPPSPAKSKDNSFLLDEENELGGLKEESKKEEERWDRYLNWATGDNPDGIGIVHDAMDQVSS